MIRYLRWVIIEGSPKIWEITLEYWESYTFAPATGTTTTHIDLSDLVLIGSTCLGYLCRVSMYSFTYVGTLPNPRLPRYLGTCFVLLCPSTFSVLLPTYLMHSVSKPLQQHYIVQAILHTYTICCSILCFEQDFSKRPCFLGLYPFLPVLVF